MQTYDAIVVGNGLAGAALSYELVKAGQAVLLIDNGNPHSGTRYSYGGIGYWAGTTPLTDTLLREGIARHRQLPEELGAKTELRELTLLLTVEKGADLAALQAEYQAFLTPPRYIDAQQAQVLEPQLNAAALEGAFVTGHGHVNPTATVAAYNQAFRRLGGHHSLSAVTGLVQIGDRITGVTTAAQAYPANQVILATGAWSQSLLTPLNLAVPLHFTHAEIIETPPVDITLRSLILPAANNRFHQEIRAARSPQWQQPNHQVMPPVLEAGVIQFADKSLRIGQISRFHTAYEPPTDAAESEAILRRAIAPQLPALKNLPGTWRHCLVSFTPDGLPLVGPLSTVSGLALFTGFTGPFAMVPPLAQRYARQQSTATADPLLTPLAPARWI